MKINLFKTITSAILCTLMLAQTAGISPALATTEKTFGTAVVDDADKAAKPIGPNGGGVGEPSDKPAVEPVGPNGGGVGEPSDKPIVGPVGPNGGTVGKPSGNPDGPNGDGTGMPDAPTEKDAAKPVAEDKTSLL
ncbi:MAG: hypothetical protein RSB39_08615, partial [Oscillospiraceae bacterium]